MSYQTIWDELSKLTNLELMELYNMSKCNCKDDSKDAEDYVINNDNGVGFIKTKDGRYYRTQNVNSFSVYYSTITNEFTVLGYHMNDGSFTIETFKDKADAESFLADLIDNLSE